MGRDRGNGASTKIVEGICMKMEKIFVAGHNGLVGRAICRALQRKKNTELVVKDRNELDLRDALSVQEFLKTEQPDSIIMAAAKVGGIQSNYNFPAQFIYDNLVIQTNLIHGSHIANVQKLLFLGSSCIYPKHTVQPIEETSLLSGALEQTNEPYAIAKIAGMKMCESYNREYNRDYRAIMPTNLFGSFDNFHAENSHVIPALLRRIHEAKVQNKKKCYNLGFGECKEGVSAC
jgi:GDP-L-fucose synthase